MLCLWLPTRLFEPVVPLFEHLEIFPFLVDEFDDLAHLLVLWGLDPGLESCVEYLQLILRHLIDYLFLFIIYFYSRII